jgi:hypothetical protein
MPFNRPILILLAAGMLAVALFLATQPSQESAPPPPAGRTATALPLPVPTAAPTGAAPAASTPASTTPPDAAPPPPRIGSEGYGPHIERAQEGNDVAAAWEAAQWLRLCASNDERRTAFEQARNQGAAPEAMTPLIAETDAEARRCQTVTARHRAMLPELAARAMRAGQHLAAQAYASAVSPADLSAAQRREVADALRHDAVTEGVMGLLAAVEADAGWGLSDAERLGFFAALKQLADEEAHSHAPFKLLQPWVEGAAIHFKTRPTPEQQAAAELAGKQIVARLRAGNPP